MTQDAVGIAESVRSGAMSVTEVVTEHLHRIGEDPLNAFTDVQADSALARAEALDRRRDDGEDLGALAGVPVALKDLIDQAGFANTAGSIAYRKLPTTSATVVDRLEAADAVVIGRTGLHEFAFGFSSENHHFGPVRNPWNPDLSPGGSSGGSGAAVAAELAALGIGTDTGGSVRVPAALCGAFGLKVTHGRIPISGVFPLVASIDTVGPITRSGRDLIAAYAVMAGHDPADPWSARRPVTGPHEITLGDVTFAVPHPWVDHLVDPEVRRAYEAALAAAADAGAQVVHVEAPELDPPGMIDPSMGFEVAAVHRETYLEDPEAYGPEVRERISKTFDVTTDQYLDALAWRASLRHRLSAVLQPGVVLATPTVAAMRKVIGDPEITIEGTTMPYRRALALFTAMVNHSGCPAVALPLARPELAAGSPPPSLQLIGDQWSEPMLLGVSLALETAGIAGFRAPSIGR